MTTPDIPLPLERSHNLATLSEAGYETRIAAVPEELARLATWAGVDSVNSFEGKVTLKRLSQSRFAYRAELSADFVQHCVVTLEPILANISLDFVRTLQLVSKARGAFDPGGELDAAAGDDEVPEEIDNSRFNLAAPLLEEFSLAIDPYPHAPGVVFEAPVDPADIREHPFAGLKVLKGDG